MKEQNETNMKILKLSEVAHKTLDNLEQIKQAVQNYATMLTCMVEYNQIQNEHEYN